MNRLPLALALLAASAPAFAASALTNIGVAAAVRGKVQAVAPGQAVGRVIGSGKPVYLNDHVTTGADSRLQLLLLDETAFTLGPNSDMVLDEFVYDPKTSSGKVSAQITKGAFRFVTGKVAQHKPSDMKVGLPTGTIGIRGTMVAGVVNGQDADIMLVGPGPQNNANERPGGITVTSYGRSVDIDASGYGTTIRGGGAPSAGVRFSPQQSGAILNQLAAPGGAASNSGASSNQTAADGGVQGSASQNSGENTASGGVNYQGTAGDLVAQNDDTSNFAAQQAGGVQDGVADWSQVLGITSGDGYYSGNGVYNCASGCVGSGGFNFSLVIDFGARQVGGFGSFSSVNIADGDLTSYTSGSTIFTTSYDGLTGPAHLGLTFSDPSYSGTVDLLNKAGKVADQATLSFSFNTNTVSASGSATGGLTQPVPPN